MLMEALDDQGRVLATAALRPSLGDSDGGVACRGRKTWWIVRTYDRPMATIIEATVDGLRTSCRSCPTAAAALRRIRDSPGCAEIRHSLDELAWSWRGKDSPESPPASPDAGPKSKA